MFLQQWRCGMWTQWNWDKSGSLQKTQNQQNSCAAFLWNISNCCLFFHLGFPLVLVSLRFSGCQEWDLVNFNEEDRMWAHLLTIDNKMDPRHANRLKLLSQNIIMLPLFIQCNIGQCVPTCKWCSVNKYLISRREECSSSSSSSSSWGEVLMAIVNDNAFAMSTILFNLLQKILFMSLCKIHSGNLLQHKALSLS